MNKVNLVALAFLTLTVPLYAAQPDEGGIGGTGNVNAYQHDPFELPDTLQELSPPDIQDNLSRDDIPGDFRGIENMERDPEPVAPEVSPN